MLTSIVRNCSPPKGRDFSVCVRLAWICGPSHASPLFICLRMVVPFVKHPFQFLDPPKELILLRRTSPHEDMALIADTPEVIEDVGEATTRHEDVTATKMAVEEVPQVVRHKMLQKLMNFHRIVATILVYNNNTSASNTVSNMNLRFKPRIWFPHLLRLLNSLLLPLHNPCGRSLPSNVKGTPFSTGLGEYAHQTI